MNETKRPIPRNVHQASRRLQGLVCGSFYITGISGSGKSSVCEELVSRGYKAYDADKIASAFYKKDTGQKVEWKNVPPEPRGKEWDEQHAWTLSYEIIKKLTQKAKKENIYLCGVGYGEKEVWDFFGKVIALTIDEKTLRYRLSSRKNNEFGKASHQLKKVLEWQQYAEAEYQKLGAITIDATQPIDKVIDDILELSESLRAK